MGGGSGGVGEDIGNHNERFNDYSSGSGNTADSGSNYNHLVNSANHAYSSSYNSISGNANTANGAHFSIIGGQYNTVTGSYNTVGGKSNTAASSYSGVFGLENENRQDCSVVGGESNKNYASRSIIAGYKNTNSGGTSIVSGWENVNSNASDALLVGYNNVNQCSRAIMCGQWGYNQNNYIAVGGGSDNINRELIFYVDNSGATYAAGGYTSPAADYAEYFEWADGNPENEDRRGMLVQLVGDKIAPAHGDDILGIISACPSVVGNAYSEHWHGRYKRDIFGAYILDENGDKQISEDYDKDREYIPRSQRQEWATVGLLGQLVIRDNGKCQPGGYVEARQGIGVPTFTETKIRCMKRLDDSHSLCYVGR